MPSFRRIPCLEEERVLEVVDCFVGKVKESSLLSSLICQINSQFPLSKFDLGHLKRVKRTNGEICILLFPSHQYSLQEAKQFNLEIVNSPVSRWPATTREQFLQWNSIWPMSFHDGQSLPKDLSPSQNDKMVRLFLRLFPITKLLPPQSANQAFIVDDEADEDAESQETFLEAKEANLGDFPLGHACMLVLEKNAAQQQKNPTGKGYLCKGKSLLIRREPCLMCSMALVHSRIENVFFEEPNLESGGLMSQVKIEHLKSLNHHFGAFQFIRE